MSDFIIAIAFFALAGIIMFIIRAFMFARPVPPMTDIEYEANALIVAEHKMREKEEHEMGVMIEYLCQSPDHKDKMLAYWQTKLDNNEPLSRSEQVLRDALLGLAS